MTMTGTVVSFRDILTILTALSQALMIVNGLGMDASLHSEENGKYSIVIRPVRTDRTGQPYPLSQQNYLSTNSAQISNTSTHTTNDVLYYHLPLPNRTLKLVLESAGSQLLTPDMTIQYIQNDRMWHDDNDGGHCLYRGTVEDLKKPVDAFISVVTINLCDGMSGVLQYNGIRYVISPRQNDTGNRRDPLKSLIPHLVYIIKMSDLKIRPNHEPNHELHPQSQSNSSQANLAGLPAFHHQSSSVPSSSSSSSSSSSHNHHRHKRSVPWESYVQTLVVADHTMVQYHKDRLQHYILTLMATVANIYRDPTIQNTINIVLSKVIIIKNKKDGPEVTKNALSSLTNFCKWQRKFNRGNGTGHHDTAILLTRLNICRSNSACDTLGLAEIGAICHPYKSCSIIEENGMGAAFTMAHELGHLFNLPHDDDRRCMTQYPEHQMRVMGPVINFKSIPWTWSQCSADIMTDFLKHNHAKCLLDKPSSELIMKKFRRMLRVRPGEEFSVNEQCEMIYGEGSALCPYTNYVGLCSQLWCTVGGALTSGCRTRRLPWADGTICSKGKWCQKGQCVMIRPLKYLDGGWGNWGPYQQCSRTCGGGIARSYRTCSNPMPRNSGKLCVGMRERYKSCNIESCADDSDDREDQCAKFDGKKFNNNALPHHVHWIPKYGGISGHDQCKLFCQVPEGGFYFALSPKVIDGTKCNPFTNDICINGRCEKAGCDNFLGGDAKYDECGVCGGDNTTCITISGTYNPHPTHYGYNFVTTIPKYSSKIYIRQFGHGPADEDDNFLALMSSSQKRYILNGEYVISVNKKSIRMGRTMIEYSGSNVDTETIFIERTIREDIVVLVLSVKNLRRPNVAFSYMKTLGDEVRFQWEQSETWSECTRPCQGKKRKELRCVRLPDRKEFPASKCKNNSIIPVAVTEKCNSFCRFTWYVRKQSPCSTWCGTGKVRRQIVCMRQTHNNAALVNPRSCEITGRRPPESGNCRGPCGKWKFGPWSGCSKSCGGGMMLRKSTCADKHGKKMTISACHPSKRHVSDTCNTHVCPQWAISNWTECRVKCGTGSVSRTVLCVGHGEKEMPDAMCTDSKPNEYQPCVNRDCSNVRTASAVEDITQPFVAVAIPTSTAVRPEPSPTVDKPTAERYNTLYVPATAAPTVPTTTHTTTATTSTSALTTTLTTPPPTRVSTTLTPTKVEMPVVQSTSISPIIKSVIISAKRSDAKKNPSVSKEKMTDNHVRKEPMIRQLPTRLNSIVKEIYDRQVINARIEEKAKLSNRITETTVPIARRVDNNIDSNVVPVHLNSLDNERESERKMYEEEIRRRNKEASHTHDNRVATNTVIWRTGRWTECDEGCGLGSRERYVSCVDMTGRSVSMRRCQLKKRPESREACMIKPCNVWRHGEWSKCTRVCGGGVKRRYVACITLDEHLSLSPECEMQIRPEGEIECNTNSCVEERDFEVAHISNNDVEGVNQWKVGPWGQCSRSCGSGGVKQRGVTCLDERGPSQLCDSDKEPTSTAVCDNGPCPIWNHGRWGACSVSCGVGVQSRVVNCQSRDLMHSDVSCDLTVRPEEERSCNETECPPKPFWNKSAWSPCSVTCGHGRKSREVSCSDVNGNVYSDRECAGDRPPHSKHCRRQKCPVWIAHAWSECSNDCGVGTRSRALECRIGRKKVDEVRCKYLRRPKTEQRCRSRACSRFAWRTSSWSECSQSCGSSAIKHRLVRCYNVSNSVSVTDTYCNPANRPKSRKRCKLEPCPFLWHTDSWSECSKSCGQGYQQREITCRRISKEGWMLNAVNDINCQLGERPAKRQRCNFGDCQQKYRWQTSPWRNCSASCGKGWSSRHIRCVGVINGLRSSNKLCNRHHKPDVKQSCYTGPCYATSCLHLKTLTGIKTDGEYRMKIHHHYLVKIYCRNMKRSRPKEYLSLVGGAHENYSEVYDKKLQSPSTCPYAGVRNDSCDCSEKRYGRAGYTGYGRIRLDIEMLRIIANDFTYTSTRGKKQIPYGMAGDCYSKSDCPQGRFRINLTGSDFAVARQTRWKAQGKHVTTRIVAIDNHDQIITGRCGGRCGHCIPDPVTGLKLVILAHARLPP